MSDLLQTCSWLAVGLRNDPLFSLASCVAWLDPLWKDAIEDWDEPHDETGTLMIALSVTRQAFPEVYIQAVDAIRHGVSYGELDRLICREITAQGIPLDNLDGLDYGIPLPAHGVVLNDPDIYTAHPDVIPVLECFGISPEPDPYSIDIPDCVYTAGRLIASDLEKHPDERFRQISWLMQWLFSCSGNSCIDWDYDHMSEIPPLTWDQEDVLFAIEIIQEANGVLADALAGLTFLLSQPDLLTALQRNVQRIYRAIKLQRGKRGDPKVRLHWL